MASIQLTNRLTATDKNIFTPNSSDATGTTTRAKDYLLEVQLVNEPISIDLFKDASTYDPYVEVYQIPKGSRGANLAETGTFVAQDDDSGGGLNSRIAALTSLPGVDYVVRVTSFSALSSLPQPFTLQVSTPNGTVALKDPVTGVTLDAAGNIIPGSGGDPLTGNLPVRRFFDKTAGGHFYTTDPTEKNERLNNPTRYQSEGDEFIAPAAGNAKVQRFFNTASGTYFYTNKPTDIQFVRDNLPQFRAEGEVFNSYNTAVSGAIPVFRFTNLARERENPQNITHFYTASAATRAVVQARSDFRDEGVAFYALPPT
ncbi:MULTISPECIES: hypothetical protein [Kamptonema]|uniref:hypothetical protein n=1 Tax=Kamptonema TaxID=1501433 RepID=UPI0001DACFD6|nr:MULTISPECIES: hypothetical protein [Kamptonema]CBN54024.1 hypothetical protein OSCI_450008 [Kamptonema sp. PCC 6506]